MEERVYRQVKYFTSNTENFKIYTKHNHIFENKKRERERERERERGGESILKELQKLANFVLLWSHTGHTSFTSTQSFQATFT